MPYQDKRTGKYHARLQFKGKRYSLGTYKTKKEAEAAEDQMYFKLNAHGDDIMVNVQLEYEQTPASFIWREVKSFFARRKANRKQDNETTEKLEQL